jgi:glycosyltransferase involved in cell wall biosynthesis
VHVHTASFWSFRRLFFVMMLTRLRRKKLVIHLHGGQFDDYYRRAFFLEQWCIRLAFSGADRVVLLAEHLREKVNGVCQPERCLIIPNGVVVPELADTSLGQQSPQRMILFLGDIVRRKGVYDLVDAVACINTQIPFNVVLAGAGETQEVVGYAAAKQGAAHFTFPGWVSGAVKEALVRNALAFVLPSYAESMPMSILEAMSYGVPVVATTVGGIPEIIRHGIEGILVAPGDVEGLARALQELLEDEAKRLAMSRACRERVQELFSAERVENALCCLYGELAVGSH